MTPQNSAGFLTIFAFLQQSFVTHAGLFPQLFERNKCPIQNIKNAYASYQHIVVCDPSERIHYPLRVEEVVSIVKRASSTGKRIKVVGALHSQTDIICTDGIPISLIRIKGAEYHQENETVTFAAGTLQKEASIFLEGHGRALEHLPAYDDITIGGALGAGSHGSSLIHSPTISDFVVRLTVINSEGELLVIEDPDELKAYRIHLGLLGVIVNATLRTVPMFKISITNTLHSDQILHSQEALEWARTTDFFMMYWFPSARHTVSIKGLYQPMNLTGRGKLKIVEEWKPFPALTVAMMYESAFMTRGRNRYEVIRDLSKRWFMEPTIGRGPALSEDGKFQNPVTGNYYDMLASSCRPGTCMWEYVRFQDFEIAFDLDKFSEVMHFLSERIRQKDFFRMMGVLIRFLKASDAIMSTTNGKDCFSLKWYVPTRWTGSSVNQDNVAAMNDLIHILLTRFGGRPHWAKPGMCHTDANSFTNVQGVERFAHIMREKDPSGLFLNDFGERLLTFWKAKPEFCKGIEYRDICAKGSGCETLPSFCDNQIGSKICGERDPHFVCLMKLMRAIVPHVPERLRKVFTA